MIWDRFTVIRALIPHKPSTGDTARRWRNARAVAPELAADVIRFSGLLTMQPARFVDGFSTPELDPARLAYEAGRRDLGLQLLALMGVSQTELNAMMEDR
ncbi:hypothetical protein PARHAE_01089 [Paracoccus haematequi]|uniref:Uncharacterized protein n=1 Tax=Paracoccus haematequi TaxID=2491866 RepID=A0A3S4GPQ7_9RHOB|nr:hypothetical protein [Paracoccus haematequi]VDS07909.1 hypothetical protein PARHAE_01089 [Paracoccus haematequi]